MSSSDQRPGEGEGGPGVISLKTQPYTCTSSGGVHNHEYHHTNFHPSSIY